MRQTERVSEADGELEREVRDEIAEGTSKHHPLRQWIEARRAWVNEHPRFRMLYLIVVATIGVAVIAVGLTLLVLPGPGWLIIFLGLAILGTEFHWARRLTGWVKHQLNRFWAWWRARRRKSDD